MLKRLLTDNGSKIIFLIMDGLGDIRNDEFPQTALEAASCPNLDSLAGGSICGRSLPISPGITPGSGPAHFALFGYDPLAPENDAGRGVVEVTGVGYELGADDIAIRGNFATIDSEGILIDRRAGRISHEEGVRICGILSDNIREIDGVEIIVMPIKEYRFGLVLRGKGLSPDVEETDPQKNGLKALPPVAMSKEAERTAAVIAEFVRRAEGLLAKEEKARTTLMRGISRKPVIEHFEHRFGLRGAAVAAYPLYRGVARLCGMQLLDTGSTPAEEFETVRSAFGGDHDFFFIHIKKTDSSGEDGNLQAKKEVIEQVDKALPVLTGLDPDVIVITGDHSTPCAMKSHSWHPVPLMIWSKTCGRDDVTAFSEAACDRGALGVIPAKSIMELVLANAGRLKKYGA